jgi:hypothetical protein
VSVNQIIFGAVLVATLVFLGVFYAWRQVLALRRLRTDADPTSDEAFYQRRRARRRLINSGLMLVLAGLLGGILLSVENKAEVLARERVSYEEGQAPDFTPEERSFVYLYSGLWITFLVVLLAVVIVAAVDAWSTRSFALRAFRKLQADRNAMIERQVLRMRQDRNGH